MKINLLEIPTATNAGNRNMLWIVKGNCEAIRARPFNCGAMRAEVFKLQTMLNCLLLERNGKERNKEGTKDLITMEKGKPRVGRIFEEIETTTSDFFTISVLYV